MTFGRTFWAVSILALLFLFPVFVYLIPASQPETSDEAVAEHRQHGRFYQALYLVETQAARDGWSPELLLLAGDLWRDMGDITRALPYWEQASLSMGEDSALSRRLAETYIQLQDWPDAVDQLVRLVSDDEADAWAQFHLGIIRAASDPRMAVRHLQAAVPVYGRSASDLVAVINRNQDDPLIAMRVGLALTSAELWPYAELAFRYAADIAPDYAEALAYTALVRDEQGKDSRLWIARAVALAPESAIVRYVQGLHLRRHNDLTGSLDAFVQAVALDPANPAYFAELSTAYRLLDDMASAERWLQVAVDVSNEDPRFQQLLALFYAEESQSPDDAQLALIQRLVAAMPDNFDVQAGYGWMLYNSGDVDGALESLNAVLEDDIDHPRALFYKAKILLETGDREGAVSLFEQVAGYDSPFREEANRILQTLTDS